MTDETLHRTRLETEAIVVGYAMSRLDDRYLTNRNLTSWQQAFAEAGSSLSEPPTSFKNLRDEFDPVHSNARLGWHKRPMRQNRQRVLDELAEVSDDALLEMVRRILLRDEEAVVEAVDALAVVTRRPANVAERLLTGRRAEEYFLEHCRELVQVEKAGLADLRQAACGYDFGVANSPDRAIEVKGLKQSRGGIQFTDREWSEAGRRRAGYLLVVVGNLASEPVAGVFQDPYGTLEIDCRMQSTLAAVWSANVTVG